jgi:hypothetical protein
LPVIASPSGAAPPRLLLPDARDLLHHVVVDVSVGDDLATPAVGVAKNNLDGLLIVRDLFLREIAYEDRFSRHSYSLRYSSHYSLLPSPERNEYTTLYEKPMVRAASASATDGRKSASKPLRLQAGLAPAAREP